MTDIKHLITTAALLGSALFCSCADAQEPTQVAPPPTKAGTWIGGIGSLDDDTLSWDSVRVELEQQGNELQGRLKTDDDRNYSVRIFDDGGKCKAAIERKRERIFDCERFDDVITASIDDGQLPNTLMLRRIEPLTAERLAQFSGVYETEDGRRINFRPQETGLSMTDFVTGKIRFLYPISDDQFVAGPAIAIPHPVETKFHFHTDSNGKSSSVTIQPIEGSTAVAKRQPGPRIEEFVYDSFDGTKIAGSLYLPNAAGPFPAIVWVHGSGPATRQSAGSWPWYFADLGFAVLAVDKRGVGKSDGTYQSARSRTG